MPSPYSASRFTNLVLTGNLGLARRSASRAISSDTPAISNITLPRLTGCCPNLQVPFYQIPYAPDGFSGV